MFIVLIVSVLLFSTIINIMSAPNLSFVGFAYSKFHKC